MPEVLTKEEVESLSLIAMDHLCLKSITRHFRCDNDALHSDACSHFHRDKALCDWHEVWGPEFVAIHRGNR